MKKSTVLVLVVAALFAVGGWLWKRGGNGETTYQTVTVGKGDITQTVTATGTLNPVLNVQVGSQISGIVAKLYADFNSSVKAGQVVAEIDPATYKATVMQGEGDLASAHAALELAQVNEKRARELREQNASPQANLDSAVAALHQAEATVKVKEGALAKAKADLDRCTISSPIDGMVISRNVDVGQTVAASLSAPVIFTIANDLTKMQIDSNVAEADVGNVQLGQPVDFTVDAFPTRTFHGKVVQVRNAPITVQNVVSYDTVIQVQNDDLKLKPGMTAGVSVVIAQRTGVLKVSNAALRFRMPEAPGATTPKPAPPEGFKPGGKKGGPKADRKPVRNVYVLRDGKPQQVQVKTGISDGIFTEILEGLSEGDQVVIGSTGPSASATPPPANPFGGGRRGF